MSEIRPVKVGEVVFWLGSGSGVPKRGRVKWLGRLAEIGPGLAVGLELDEELPYGGVDGQWCGRRLFPCQPKRGLIVPAGVLLRPSQAHRVVGSSSAPPREKKRIERYARIQQTEEDVAGEEEARSGELRLEEGRRMTGGGLENHQDAAPSPPVERLEWRRLELAGEHRSSRSSGIFSLLKWFRKSSEEGDEIRRRSGGEDPDSGSEADSSPELPGPRCGGLSASLDSLFSTATAASFAFISPTQYRPFGPGADTPQVRIAVGPETATYRNRIRNRDRLRALEKNITLRQKYRLYASGTLPRSVDHINELKDPYDKSSQSQTLDKKKTSAPKAPTQEVKSTVSCTKEHRRTASEPYKVCHVKGKRKAPAPPSVEPDILSVSTSNSNSSRRSRKKRRAPSPPVRKANASDSDIIHIIREATSSILSEGDSSVRDDTLSTASTVDVGDVVCTDTLRLERGILKPNMEKTMSSSESKVAAPSSPVSPRPWYKRTTPSRYPTRDQRDKKKERDRRKVEDWMLESGFPRRTFHEFKHHNILSKLDKSDDKRKSQVSILTNISELDREAAEIIKRGKEKEKSQIDNHNAMFYDENMQVTEVNDNSREIHENPRKSSARDLISLFNAITNVTKVTVNSSLFPKDIKILNKESKSKCSSHKYEQNVDGKQQIQKSSSDEVMHGKFVMKSNSAEVMRDEEKAGPSSASSSSTRIARVTIQELDDFDAERNLKSQAIKPNLHNPPSVQKSGREPEPQGSASSDLTRATPTDSVPKALLTSDSKPTPVKQLNVWICPRCTLENLRWRITCEACDMWRPNPFEIREKSNTNIKEKEKNTNKTEEKSTKQMTKEANSVYPSLSPINISSSDENKETFKNSPSSDSGSTASNDIQSQQKLKGSLSTLIENKSNLNVKDISKNTEIGNSANISKTSSDDKHNSELVKEKKLHSTDKIQENSTGKLILDSEKKFDGTKKEISKTQETTKNENEEAQSELVSDEVRKARLAFFDKSSISKNKDDNKSHSIDKEEKKENSSNISEINKLTRNEFNETKNQQGNNKLEMKSDKFKSEISEPIRKPKVLCVTEDEEKNKLKEMLIEMKHSLPKRPKPFKKSENINIVSVSDDKVKTNVVAKPIPEEKLSIRVDSTPSTSSSHPGKDYAEAYLIESTTVIEEIQYNKPKSNDKVSSSVQTSGLVRQISPRIKASSGQTKYIPIRIEEHTVQDNGTDVQTEVTEGIGKMGGGGTFELLRPRDFANIRETRTDSSRSGPLPLYANVVSEDEGSQRASEELRQSTSEYIDKLSEQLVKPQGVANFRAGLTGRSEECLNTLGVNRQLKRLETAISAGDHELAARLARELAQLKVSCSVVRQGSSKDLPSVPSPPGAGEITLDVYVEDRQSSEGPFPVRVMPDRLTVGELKRRVELEFGIPASVQRWILGNQLASTEGASLEELGVNTDHFPAFLYLVAPDINGIKKEEEVQIDIGPSSSGLGSKGVIQEPTEPANQANILPAATTNIPTAATTNIPTATTTNIPTATTTTKNIPTATNLPTITTNIPTATTTINIPTATKTTPNKPAATTTNIPAATTTNIPAATITNIPPTTTTESGAALTGEWGAAQIQPGPSGLAATGTRSWLQTEDSSGTLALGWKCESCTLLNSPTRPGCAACSRPRPTDYRVPGEYRPSPAEAVRIRKEMEGEQALKVVEKEEEKAQNYQKLVDLEKDDLILYPEEFECPVCLSDYPKNEGIVLRECLHVFCRACLEQTVEFSEEAEVSCPYRDDNYTCSSLLLEREIKALVSAEAYEEHLAKSLAQAENKTANAFHCKTPDCSGWCIFEDNVNLFTCPVCTHTNCLTCQAVHEGLNCKQYQEHLASNSDSNIDVKRTKEMLQDMVRRGEALTCPTCQVVLMKKWGCDWLRCSMCKTEICWITRGPRWGPNGKGDTSGGCQCGVNGIKCHPKCTYCH